TAATVLADPRATWFSRMTNTSTENWQLALPVPMAVLLFAAEALRRRLQRWLARMSRPLVDRDDQGNHPHDIFAIKLFLRDHWWKPGCQCPNRRGCSQARTLPSHCRT